MSLELGMLVSFVIILLGGLFMAGIVMLLRKRDSVKSAKADSAVDQLEKQKN